MEYCSKGGFIHGKEIVKGNSIVNDTVKLKGINGANDIHVSPGEIVLDKETISKGMPAIVDKVRDELSENKDAHDKVNSDVKTMAEGGKIDNSISPDNALNHYINDKGIVGGTVYDGSTDERFLFGDYCFDIEKAREICGKKSNMEIPVSQKWIDKIALDPKEAMKSKSKNPVFIAQIHTPNGIKPLLIDGNHRMYKAIQDGKKSIPAYLFTPEQTTSLFTSKPEGMEHPKYGSHNNYYPDGGVVNPNYQGVQNYFNPNAEGSGTQAGGGNIDKSADERIRQLDAIKNNLRPLNQSETVEYNTLKARQSSNFADGGTVGWDAAPPTKDELSGAKSSQSWDSTPPTKDEIEGKKPESSLGEKIQTGLENFGNTVSLGYLPQLQAGATKGLEAAGLLPESDYIKDRDENIARIAKESADNPKSALAGTAAGLITSAAATPALDAITVPGKIAQGAALGAGFGLAQNPGDVPGEVNPLQGGERLKNAELGAGFGVAAGTGSALIGKGIGVLRNSAKTAEEIAQEQAVNASGAMKRDFKLLDEKGRLNDVGQYGLDHGIVEAGDTVESIASKADQARRNAGKVLDYVYDSANQSMSPEDAAKIKGFNPARDKTEILEGIKSQLSKDPDRNAAVNAVSSYLDQLGEGNGDRTFSPGEANEIKTMADSKINYNRKSALPDPATEKGFSALRGYIADAIEKHVQDVGEASGNPDLAKTLQDANKQYGYASTLKNMAEDRLAALRANHRFGLIDTISGIGGATTGAIAGEELGGHPLEGAGLGLLMGLASKGARTYGPAITASLANKAVPILEKTAVPVGEALSRLPEITKPASQYFTRTPINQSRYKLSDFKGAK